MALIAVVLLQLLLLPFCFGQSPPAPPVVQLPAGVQVSIQAQPRKATVGDLIQIDLDITLPEGYRASLPKLGNQLGDFTIQEYYPGPSVPSARTVATPSNGKASREAPNRHKARIVAALYRTGEFEFPPLPISLRSPDGKNFEIVSQPIKIQIQSVLADKDPQLKGLKKQAEIREPIRLLLWLALAFLTVILAILAWWLHQRSRRPAIHPTALPPVDALILAETDLRDLTGRGLLEKGFVKQFYVLLSEIVKRILEAGYAIHTIEKTSPEIMEELQHSPAARHSTADLQRIESVLFECDLVKFAKYTPSRAESDLTVKNTFQILESARKLRSTSPVAQEATVAGVS
ncbi:MAG TPA: hypothetical protein VE398_14660 [Acidobacteriota bacterium]|nr:hypothetical protein [Acidobacteriota bacterium]